MVKDERLALFAGVLGRYDHGTNTRSYEPGEPLPFGGSFAIRRSLVDRAARFRPELARIGIDLGLGEGTEFLQRATAVEGIYVGKALCWHKVDPRRLSVPIDSGRAHLPITQNNQPRSLWRVPLHITRGLVQLFKGRGDRFGQCIINASIEIGLRPRPATSLSVGHRQQP
jgi:hypothetical protein